MTQPDASARDISPRAARHCRRVAFAALWLCFSALLALSVGSAYAQTKTTPQISLRAAETLLPTDATADFSANVFVTSRIDSMQVRLQILGTSGKLLYQRTQYATDVEPGAASFTFSRDLSGLRLAPGIYPVRLTVKTSNDTSTDTTSATTSLMLYAKDGEPAEVAVIVRVHGAPLFDADGALSSDPAERSQVRDEVRSLCALIEANPTMRLTLAVPPMLLEEWSRLGEGYTAEGQPAATDSEAQYWADALTTLAGAMQSGRLEVVSEGYADPDLTDLAQHSLLGDLEAQYRAGAAAIVGSLGATASAGSAPAGGSVPASALRVLAEQDVEYVVVGSEYATTESRPSASGAYPLQGSAIRALVADYAARRALASGETSEAISAVFGRYLAAGTKGPFVVVADIGEAEQTLLPDLERFLMTLGEQPWAQMLLGGEAAEALPKGSAAVELNTESADQAPAGYWDAVESASGYSSALRASLASDDPENAAALRSLLLAESSAWKGGDSEWNRAEEGLAHANASLGISQGVLGKLYVRAEPITLAGTQGNVPINIGNETEKTLKVTVVTKSSGGVGVTGARSFETTLPPQETFVQVPVTMTSSSGQLEVDVMAGDLVIASRTVEVKASYLDRIAIIAMVILGLVVMLVFIRKRVGSAGDAEGTSER